MPNSFIDDFLQGIDPIDAATLFAGLRNSVPLGMAFRSGELNAGHDEELARRQGPRVEPARPALDPQELNRRAMLDFESQYPDPRIRQLLIDAMLTERRDPYSSTTATRRRDFEEAPMTARHSMQAAPKPRRFNKGGSAKKTLDEMAAELMRKGTKVADKPDLSRRGFFGLGSNPAFPLANLDTKALEKMQSDLKGAPAITEKTVTIDPGKGAAKSTLKSLSETPVSRREVLKTAAGQVVRGALPDLGGLGDVAKIAESAADPMAAIGVPSGMPGLIAAGLSNGMSEEDVIRMILDTYRRKGVTPGQVEGVVGSIKDPTSVMFEEPVGAGRAMMEMIGTEGSPLSNRGALRYMRKVAPEKYDELRQTAKDVAEYGFEN